MVKNAYIHIPFCRQKCHYCSFVSFPRLDLKSAYIEALCKEIKHYYHAESLNTLYFGGGTPSLLSTNDFRRIITLFNINDKTEITAELNPENITLEYLEDLRVLGINRLSFGCQTFNETILKRIGRRHSANDVLQSVQLARNAGFENINLDFIYGLPAQSVEKFIQDLSRAVSLGIEHISLYGLKIDESCYFATHIPDDLPDEDMQAQMYEQAIETLQKSEFEHYEISNFARAGRYSRHNLNYWNNAEYYGFGTAAHGYLTGIRYANKNNLKEYLQKPLEHETLHEVTEKERLEEEIFLGFRRCKGIDVAAINKKFAIDFDKKYEKPLQKYSQMGYLEKTPVGYKLTTQGILISNYILADFLEVD